MAVRSSDLPENFSTWYYVTTESNGRILCSRMPASAGQRMALRLLRPLLQRAVQDFSVSWMPSGLAQSSLWGTVQLKPFLGLVVSAS
jgi:hypothetical protein